MIRARFAFLAVAALLVPLIGAAGGEDAKLRTDLYGDPLPPSAVARLGTIRLRHADADATFSKDGKHLISCGIEGEVRVWDVASGALLRQKRLSEHPFARMVLSPDGTTAVGQDETTLYVYDTRTGTERGRIDHLESDSLLLFSPDGKLLVVQVEEEKERLTTQIWDVVEVKKHRTLRGPEGSVDQIAFTPDGKRLIGRVGDHLYLWNSLTGEEISKGKHTIPERSCLAFSPDGKTLAVSSYSGDETRLLDATTFKEKKVLKGPEDNARVDNDRLIFSPDGRFLAGACSIEDRSILLWDLTGAKKPRRLPGWNIFAFSPDSKTLAYHSHLHSNRIRLWDAASDRPRLDRPGHDKPVAALAISSDGKQMVSDADDGLYLWDAASGKLRRRWEACDCSSHACLFFPYDKRLIRVRWEDTLQVLDIATGKELRRFEIDSTLNESVQFHAFALSSDGQRLTAVVSVGKTGEEKRSGKLYVWDTATGKQLRQVPYKLQERIVGLSRGRRELWSFAQAALTPDAELVSVWRDGRVGLENVATGSLLALLPQGVGQLDQQVNKHQGRAIVFSPDGRLVTAAVLQPKAISEGWLGCKGLSVIEAATGEEIFRLEIGEFDQVAFTPDGRSVIVADKRNLRVWDAITGERLHQMEWPRRVVNTRGEATVCSLAVLPGGRVATGMAEGDILIWDLAPSKWPVPRPPGDLDNKRLDALWSDLASDARRAYRAIGILTAMTPQTVPFLKDRLRPTAVDVKRIEKLLADLDGDQFETREAASRELARMRYRAEPMLRRALEKKPSPEARRRLQAILSGPNRPLAEDLRTLRAIAVLERIGTLEARLILEKLADGTAARETREAQAALQRLQRAAN
jgi:WD40 repeat protein